MAFAGAEAYGGPGLDYITNETGDQKLFGEVGNDILIASRGNDYLHAGLDSDALGGRQEGRMNGNRYANGRA